MMKRTKKVTETNVTLDSFPTDAKQQQLDNGNILNSGSSISSRSKYIASLIEITRRSNGKSAFRRKNFSVLLFVGLTALVCTLYYTNYYPSASLWTLRLGFSAATTSTSFANNISSTNTKPVARGNVEGNKLAGSITGKIKSIHKHENDGEKHKENKSLKPSAFDGSVVSEDIHGSVYSGDSNTVINVVSNSDSSLLNDGGKNGESANAPLISDNNKYDEDTQRESGTVGISENENLGKMKTWKYWAALKYWKVNENLFATTSASRSNSGDSTVKENRTARRTREGSKLLCNFPRLNPFDPSITDFLKSPPDIDCRKHYPVVFRTNFRNKLIQVNHAFPSEGELDKRDKRSVGGMGKKGISNKKLGRSNYSCCYKTISRGNGSDHNVIFSKRCHPIPKTEIEIPDHHEFISVRCKSQTRHIETSPESKQIDTAAAATVSNGTHSNWTSDASENVNNSTANKSKVYRDMFAFVPLKPLVEARIRKYEEAKRKLLYENKRSGGGTVESESKRMSGGGNGLSVLVLGLDAQSHMNFIRQMPLTYNFLAKNLSAIGLYGYTKVGDNTFPNVVSLLSGLTVDELVSKCWPTKESYFDQCSFIWKQFAASGYRTSFAEDSVWMGTFNYEKKGFLQSPTDYYLNPVSLLMAEKIGHETWGNAKLCYGPRLAFEILLDYIVKTAVTFRNSLYFQFVWANSLFHDYLNNPRLGDELLEMTLKYLSRNGYLNNTVFILLSDHGIRWGSIRSTYQGKIEERMPLAYFAFPDWFRKQYPKAISNLRKNAWRLTTPFDVHETLMDILRVGKGENLRFDRWSSNDDNKSGGDGESGESPPRGISLFRAVPLRRTCKMSGIEEHWCVCHSMQSVPINSTLVESGAEFIVGVINGLLSKHKEFCAKLELYKINEAKRKIDGDVDRGLDFDFPVHRSSNESKLQSKSTGTMRSVHNGTKMYKRNTISPKDPSISSSYSTVGPGSSQKGSVRNTIQLQIVIVTAPGHAVFEATIYGDVDAQREVFKEKGIANQDNHWRLSGDISRLNLYGDQSACVSDYTVQKYCYCQNLDNVSN